MFNHSLLLEAHYDSRPVVHLALAGTLTVALLLLGLLFLRDITTDGIVNFRSFALTGCVGYIIAALIAYRKNHIIVSSCMIITFYFIASGIALLFWGFNAPISIISAAFVILLSGVLFGPKLIIGVSMAIASLLPLIFTIHQLKVITPRIDDVIARATARDVISYIVLFAIFGLLSWLLSTRIKTTLRKAYAAESVIREQRNVIRTELENEYARARQDRQREVERLYKFATLGQSTAATLHELSNHLSILNMDIADLTQQHKNSKAIAHAQESIKHINSTLRHVRRKISLTQENNEPFSVLSATQLAIKDVRKKFQQRDVPLDIAIAPEARTIQLHGDALAWSHVITILVTNALEACQDLPEPKVLLRMYVKGTHLIVHIFDNGVGILPEQQKELFQPVHSTKPSGMGIGLYITHHIIDSQFNGTINYTYINSLIVKKSPFGSGSKFTIAVPIDSKPREQ